MIIPSTTHLNAPKLEALNTLHIIGTSGKTFHPPVKANFYTIYRKPQIIVEITIVSQQNDFPLTFFKL